jgi:2-phosphoxylose phosphatase
MEKFKVIVVMTTLLLISAGLVLADGIYNSSNTPSGLPWNTYNYCNAPHVNAQHYQEPLAVNGTGAKLVYLNVVIRHHKVRLQVRTVC